MLLNQYGYNAVTSTGGAGSWQAEWARLFTGVQNIYLLFDNDKAGRAGALRVRQSLARARIVTLPDDVKDVGELVTGKRWAAEWLFNNLS
jgi:DNA primase